MNCGTQLANGNDEIVNDGESPMEGLTGTQDGDTADHRGFKRAFRDARLVKTSSKKLRQENLCLEDCASPNVTSAMTNMVSPLDAKVALQPIEVSQALYTMTGAEHESKKSQSNMSPTDMKRHWSVHIAQNWVKTEASKDARSSRKHKHCKCSAAAQDIH